MCVWQISIIPPSDRPTLQTNLRVCLVLVYYYGHITTFVGHPKHITHAQTNRSSIVGLGQCSGPKWIAVVHQTNHFAHAYQYTLLVMQGLLLHIFWMHLNDQCFVIRACTNEMSWAIRQTRAIIEDARTYVAWLWLNGLRGQRGPQWAQWCDREWITYGIVCLWLRVHGLTYEGSSMFCAHFVFKIMERKKNDLT